MGFVSTTTTDRRYMLLKEYVACNGSISRTYGWRVMGEKTSGSYAPERRTKPSDLTAAMTARATAKTIHWTALQMVNHSTLGCSDGPHAVTETSYAECWNPGFTTGSLAPSCNVDARNKIKKISYNMAETIGEYRETVDMVTKTGHWVFDEARRAYKKLPSSLRRKWAILDVPSAYLLSSFGLVPTLSTINDACANLGTLATKPIKRRVIVTRSASQERTYKDGVGIGSAVTREWESRRLILYVTYDPASVSEFTAGNPLEAAWAATPFSWVVDYFINVGSWLSSLDAVKGVQSVRGVEVLRSGHRTVDDRVTTVAKGWRNVKPGLRYETRYTRNVVSSIPNAYTPEWRPSGSFRRLSYLLAIAAGFKQWRYWAP